MGVQLTHPLDVRARVNLSIVKNDSYRYMDRVKRNSSSRNSNFLFA